MKKFSHRQKLFMILAVALVAVLLQYAFKQALAAQILVTIVGAGIALSMLIEMIHTLKSGRYGVDLLAIIAVVSTLSVGEYWAAMVILVMLVGGDALEDYASRKANSELKALLDNSPQSAHRLTNDQIEDVHVDQVKVGDTIVVKPGELVPIDGEIIKGNTQVNESSLTGESKPIDKQVGDQVMSGSLNGDQAIVIKAVKLARDSQYQKLVALVKEAENTPAHFVRPFGRPLCRSLYCGCPCNWRHCLDRQQRSQSFCSSNGCCFTMSTDFSGASCHRFGDESGLTQRDHR